MKVDRIVRIALAFVILAAFIIGVGALLFVTDTALNIWSRLQAGPALFAWAYLALLLGIICFTCWLIWRLVIPRRREAQAVDMLDRAGIQKRIDAAATAGIDVDQAQAELARVAADQAGSKLTIVLYGEISVGKSALIGALIPEAVVHTSPVGGSTQHLSHYVWESPNGQKIELIDVPGTEGLIEGFDAVARDEALRAHVVVFVCDSDLNRQQQSALRQLVQFGKPTIIALNKADRYKPDELQLLLERLHEYALKAESEQGITVVPLIAGGEESLVATTEDGDEKIVTRQREADVAQFIFALEDMLSGDPAVIALRREQAVLQLADEKLQLAESRYKKRRAEEIIRTYTKRAIVGGLAAVSPGSDIVIQGYLGTSMTRELCGLYGQSVRDMDVERFLDLSQSRVGKLLPIALAIAGNALKAFPGAGTVAGGAVHTIAYGLIFDALGRSLAQSLAAGTGFTPSEAAASFEDSLQENIQGGVNSIVRIVLDAKGKSKSNESN